MLATLELFRIKFAKGDYNGFLGEVLGAINAKQKAFFSYANANTVNLSYRKNDFRDSLNNNFTIHPDGVGIYMASKFLFKKEGFPGRFNGTDFYPILVEALVKNNCKVFFFGHTYDTLQRIASVSPGLKICGYSSGYDYESDSLIKIMNSVTPDLIIIGLGQPLQEDWIMKYHELLTTKVIMAVGDGIKVFSGEMKRGPKFMQTLGLEWLVRLVRHPLRYWKRYILGNPLFLYRIIRAKLTK